MIILTILPSGGGALAKERAPKGGLSSIRICILITRLFQVMKAVKQRGFGSHSAKYKIATLA
jgi:hypothetical protein